jgi:hypothetical protein
MVLMDPNEKKETSAYGLPRYDPSSKPAKHSAQSSNTAMAVTGDFEVDAGAVDCEQLLHLSAMRRICSMSRSVAAIIPNACTTCIATVRGVTARAIASQSTATRTVFESCFDVAVTASSDECPHPRPLTDETRGRPTCPER